MTGLGGSACEVWCIRHRPHSAYRWQRLAHIDPGVICVPFSLVWRKTVDIFFLKIPSSPTVHDLRRFLSTTFQLLYSSLPQVLVRNRELELRKHTTFGLLSTSQRNGWCLSNKNSSFCTTDWKQKHGTIFVTNQYLRKAAIEQRSAVLKNLLRSCPVGELGIFRKVIIAQLRSLKNVQSVNLNFFFHFLFANVFQSFSSEESMTNLEQEETTVWK